MATTQRTGRRERTGKEGVGGKGQKKRTRERKREKKREVCAKKRQREEGRQSEGQV